MKKERNADLAEKTLTNTDRFIPTQDQIDTLARRMMPEIKRFFADVQIQQEFAVWQEKQKQEK